MQTPSRDQTNELNPDLELDPLDSDGENDSTSDNESSPSLNSAISNKDLNPVQLEETNCRQHQKNQISREYTETVDSSLRRTASGRRRSISSVSRTTSGRSERSVFSLQDQHDLNHDLSRQLSVADALLLTESRTTRRRDSEAAISRQHSRISEAEEDEGEYGDEGDITNVERLFTNKSTGQLDLPPDGGYGWVCVVCVTTIQACTWGANAGFGIFLEYYLSSDTFKGASAYDFAVIAGLIVFCAQFCAPFAVIFLKMIGFKLTMSIALCVHCLGYILASFATKIWHLYVCQGVLIGVSYAFLFVPASNVLPTWFLKKRAIASGFSFGGTGLGGVIYSVSVNATIKKTGDQRWALRMVGITTFFAMSLSIFFIKQRIPFQRQAFTLQNLNKNFKITFSRRVLKRKSLWYVTFWFAVCIIGYNLVIFSYATYATTMGLSSSQASTLTALINAAQTIGRPSMGFIADKWVGRINYTIIMDVVLTILILAFWINAKTFITMLFCGLMIGFSIGVGNVMNIVMIADSFPIDEFVSAWSILNMGIGFFSLPVEVIALALRDYKLSNPFLFTQVFGGLLFFISIIILAPQREWAVGNGMKKRHRELLGELKDLEPVRQDGSITNKHVETLTKDLKKELAELDELLKETPRAYFKRMFYLTKI